MTKRISLLGTTIASLALFACGPGTPTIGNGDACPAWDDNVAPQNVVTPSDTPPPTRKQDLAACTGGLSPAEIEEQLALANLVERDFAEQRACGLLLRNYAFTLSHYFAAAACGNSTYPSGFVYNGSGYYRVGNLMGVQAKLAKDTSFGMKGDDVPFDIFDQLSYSDGPLAIKAEIIADTTWSTNNPDDLSVRVKGTLSFTFEGKPKPEGLELWGIPANGTAVDKQQEELAKTIGESVAFTSEATITTQDGNNGVSYTFASSEATIDATYNSQPLGLQLIGISAKSAATNQSATLVHYGVSFLPIPHGPLSGSMIFRIEGGKFPYYVKYSYPNRVEADVEFSCMQPVP
jgi:hypothetical protein